MSTQGIKYKQSYVAPTIEVFYLQEPLHLLVSVSIEAGIQDWEEGESSKSLGLLECSKMATLVAPKFHYTGNKFLV